MKKWLNINTIEAINRLWHSGLYGMGAGALMGVIVGGIAGTIVPLIGNLIGAIIGGVAGVFVGLPAGILGPVIGERQGWRIAGAISCLMVAGTVGWIYQVPLAGVEAVVSFLALCVLGLVGYWIGSIIYSRIETSDGIYERWRNVINAPVIENLSTGQCLACIAIALLPVAITYVHIAQFLRVLLR